MSTTPGVPSGDDAMTPQERAALDSTGPFLLIGTPGLPGDYSYKLLWGAPQARSPQARLGTLVHAVLCDAMKLRLEGTAVDGRLGVTLFRSRWIAETPEFRAKNGHLFTHGSEMIRRYVDSDEFQKANVYVMQHRDAAGKPTGAARPMLEFPFNIDMGKGLSLVGRFDRVDNRNGKPVVIEYKTGIVRSDASLKTDDQLRVYAAAIADLTGADEVPCEIHWLATGHIGKVTFNAQDLADARKFAAEWTKRITEKGIDGGRGLN